MNVINHAHLKEFIQQNSYEAMPQSEAFELFSIYSILVGHLDRQDNSESLHLQGCEFGIDGLGILIQGNPITCVSDIKSMPPNLNYTDIEFLFFQSKTSEQLQYDGTSKFMDAVENFFREDITETTQQLRDLWSAKNHIFEAFPLKKSPTLKCHYITSGKIEIGSNLQKRIEQFNSRISDLNIFESDENKIEFFGSRDLQKSYQATTIDSTARFYFRDNIVMPEANDVKEAFMGFVNCKSLFKICTNIDKIDGIFSKVKLRDGVFSENIRDFSESSIVNRQIIKSAGRATHKNFIYFNNGLTIVAEKGNRTGDDMLIERYSIVNGCQTTTSLFEAFQTLLLEKDEGFIEEWLMNTHVPLRIIVTDSDEFAVKVISGTNSQNPVTPNNFYASNDFLKSFEAHGKAVEPKYRIYFERRQYQYRQHDIEKTRIIKIIYLHKIVVACVLNRPHLASRNYVSEIENAINIVYSNDEHLNFYHAISFLWYRLTFAFRNRRLNTKWKIFNYFFMFGVVYLLSKGREMVSLSKNDREKLSQSLLNLASDDDALTAKITCIHDALSLAQGSDPVTSEQLRDAIRTKSFYDKFLSHLK